jgi:hypothetical protein
MPSPSFVDEDSRAYYEVIRTMDAPEDLEDTVPDALDRLIITEGLPMAEDGSRYDLAYAGDTPILAAHGNLLEYFVGQGLPRLAEMDGAAVLEEQSRLAYLVSMDRFKAGEDMPAAERREASASMFYLRLGTVLLATYCLPDTLDLFQKARINFLDEELGFTVRSVGRLLAGASRTSGEDLYQVASDLCRDVMAYAAHISGGRTPCEATQELFFAYAPNAYAITQAVLSPRRLAGDTFK